MNSFLWLAIGWLIGSLLMLGGIALEKPVECWASDEYIEEYYEKEQ